MAAYDIFHIDAGKCHRRVSELSRLEDDSTHGGWLAHVDDAPSAEAAVELAVEYRLLGLPPDDDQLQLLVVPTSHIHPITLVEQRRVVVRRPELQLDDDGLSSSTTSASTASSS